MILVKKMQEQGQFKTSINDSCQKDARARTIQYAACFFYKNGIPFNVVQLNSFKLMIEVVENYCLHLKPPSYHELRVPLLKKELEYTKDLLRGHEEEQMKYECSIITGTKYINFYIALLRRLEKNVIQLVTDNRGNYVTVGKLLQATITKLFWTSCAVHYLDLMLEDTGKIVKVKKVIQRGIRSTLQALIGFELCGSSLTSSN
ncbi:hypothetical protein CR513_46856, partial [Mucuna pruriens]